MTKERLLQESTRPAAIRSPRAAVALWMGAALCAFNPLAAQDGATPLDANIEALDKWVEARRTLAEEQAQWEGEKARLDDMIALRTAQLKALNDAISAAQQETDVAETERTQLASSLEQMKAVEARVLKAVTDAEARMRALLPQLPVSLQQELQPLSVRLPDAGGKSGQSLTTSQRMQTIVGLLTQIEKFNDTVDINAEAREIDNRRVQVQALYFGLAAAYWVDGNGTAGGTGRPGPDGWVWERDDTLAPAIQQMIAMYKKDTTEVHYVPLPVEVTD